MEKMERGRFAKRRKLRGTSPIDNISNDGENDYKFNPPITTTSSSLRKRVRIHEKVLEDCDAVNPPRVPRKLRSTIYKRINQSAPAIDKRKSKQKLLNESMTKDEQEVAEALFVLSNMGPPSDINLNTTGASTSYSIANLEEANTKILPSCTATDKSENFEKMINSQNEQSKFERESKDELLDKTNLRNSDSNLQGSNLKNCSSQSYSCSGTMQQKKFNPVPANTPSKTDTTFCLSGSSGFEFKTVLSANYTEPARNSHAKLAIEFSNTNTTPFCKESTTVVVKPSSARTRDKLGGFFTVRKKCMTHVYVAHLIQIHKEIERNPMDQPKSNRDESKPVLPNGLNRVSSQLTMVTQFSSNQYHFPVKLPQNEPHRQQQPIWQVHMAQQYRLPHMGPTALTWQSRPSPSVPPYYPSTSNMHQQRLRL